MSDSADRPERSSFRTFWTTLPGILTGVATLITAIAGLVALFPPGGGREPVVLPSEAQTASSPGASLPDETDTSAGSISSGGAAASATGDPRADPCFVDFFADLPESRRKEIHEGSQDLVLIGPTETKRGPVGLRLVDGSEVVGALRFSFTTQGEFFTIDGIVDSRCAGVESYANASRGGDKSVLQNWDEERMSIGGSPYLLRLGYSGGEISMGYFRRIVE